MQILKCSLALAALVAASLTVEAQAQQQAPPKPPAQQSAEKQQAKAPAKKAKRVWSEEDVKDLRKPWDEHVDQKQAAEDAKAATDAKAAADKAAAEKAGPAEAKSNNPIDPATGKPYVDPDSLEGLEQQLKNWELTLQRTEEDVAAARKRMAELTDNPERWESAKLEVEILEANILDTKQRIAGLGPRIEQAKQSQGKKPAAPEKPQS